MAWGNISLFAGFLEKENSLETLIVIFEKFSPKGFLSTQYRQLRRLLQTVALKGLIKRNLISRPISIY